MLQDEVLEGCLRAAIAAVEARTGKSLLVRSFTWSVTAWRDLSRNTLPTAPVVAIHKMVDRRPLRRGDGHRPGAVCPRAGRAPAADRGDVAVPALDPDRGQRAEIQFDAGYAPDLGGAARRPGAGGACCSRRTTTSTGARARGPGGQSPTASLHCSIATATSGCSGARHDGSGADAQAGPRGAAEGAGRRRRLHRGLGGAGGALGRIRAGTGSEREAAGSLTVSTVPYRITVRAAPQGAPSRPRPDQRFRDGERIFRIVAVTERDPQGAYLECFAREEVAA